MRILQVIPSYLPAIRYGGPVFSTHALSKALVERGHEVQVYTTYRGQDDYSRRPPNRTEIDGVIVNYFRSEWLARLSWAPGLGLRLAQEIGQFDIVHLQSVFLWPTWKAARQARNRNIPYVVSPRGMLVKDLIKRRSRLVKSAWIELVEKSNLRSAAAIHVTSEREKNDLRNLFGKIPPVVIIPNGIERHQENGSVSEEIEEITGRTPYILFLGRLSWKKGLDTLLQAFAMTQLSFLVIAGTDDEGLSKSLLRLATTLGIEQRVRIIPRTVSGSDKHRLFRSARAFVLPSYSENFGNTILESLAAGVPVIVTPEVGAAEIVIKAQAGYVVPKVPRAIAQAMERLSLDEGEAKRLGSAGQMYVLSNCSWSAVATEMETLYQRCVSYLDPNHMPAP